jgi:TPR repeat protein
LYYKPSFFFSSISLNKVKKITYSYCLFFVFLFGSVSPSLSADYQKGLDAALIGDYKTALRNWTALAQEGNAFAQYNLGLMYNKGRGVPQNFKIAKKWYTLSAKQGFAFAQSNLGFMYDIGEGVSQDVKTAVKWYTLAAKQGNPIAQNNLGLKYANGQGVLKNNIRAHMWFNIAALFGERGAAKNRDKVAQLMSLAQIKTARKMVSYCIKKEYNGC